MKKSIHIIFIAILFFVVFCKYSFAQNPVKALIGEWKTEVADAPWEYRNGSIIFSETEGKLTAKISFPGQGMIPVNELKTKENKINFNVTIEGYKIIVDLVRDGDKMTGKAETPEGILQIKSTRVKK